jgi:hypothetical protein
MSKCKGVCEVFSRVTGFMRPVQEWNPGKGINGEFGDRKHFKAGGEDEKKTGGDNISRS